MSQSNGSDDDEDDLLPALWNYKIPKLTKKTDENTSADSQGKQSDGSQDYDYAEPEAKKSRVEDRDNYLKTKLTALLQEKQHRVAGDKELDEMEAKLKEGLKQGGIQKLPAQPTEKEIASATTNNLLPEHVEMLKKFEVQHTEISEVAPGEHVFGDAPFGWVMGNTSPPSLLTCGFVPGSSRTDRLLAGITEDGLVDLLSSDFLLQCLHRVSSSDAVLKWLYHILTLHPNGLIMRRAYSLLQQVIQITDTSHPGGRWIPSAHLVLNTFLNYGATASSLCLDKCLAQVTDLPVRTALAPHEEPLAGEEDYPMAHLQRLLHLITYAAIHRAHLYTEDDLLLLVHIISRLSLEETLVDGVFRHDFSICLENLFNAFNTEVWPEKAQMLALSLTKITSHHHNYVILAHTLVGGERSHYICRRFCQVVLHILLETGEDITSTLMDCKLLNLVPLLGQIVVNGDVDFYRLSSIILLVEAAVGNEYPKISEKAALQMLSSKMKTLTGDVKELVNVLDRSLLKELMGRTTANWTFMLLNMGTSQRTMFQYTHPRAQAHLAIEHVGGPQDSDADQTELEAVDQSEEDSKNLNQSSKNTPQPDQLQQDIKQINADPPETEKEPCQENVNEEKTIRKQGTETPEPTENGSSDEEGYIPHLNQSLPPTTSDSQCLPDV